MDKWQYRDPHLPITGVIIVPLASRSI